jgi:hypothetical protein
VFGMALLHPRAALLQNSRVEQLCSRVLVVFGKIGVPALGNGFLRVGRHYYLLFDQLCFIEDNEACIIIFSPIFFLHYFFANIFAMRVLFIKEN